MVSLSNALGTMLFWSLVLCGIYFLLPRSLQKKVNSFLRKVGRKITKSIQGISDDAEESRDTGNVYSLNAKAK